MTNKARAIGSWQDIQLVDLFYAYRKAKADCFHERSICAADKFVAFEMNLEANLSVLLFWLNSEAVGELLANNLGQPRVVAKKLGVGAKPRKSKKGGNGVGHAYFSDPGRAFDRLCETSDLIPEFRLVGDFPVEMHVLSALWINLVGHKFDAVLHKSACGSRLRRYRAEAGSPVGAVGDYHLDAIGSFQPYFGPYRRWREDGMKAIRTELQADRRVVAVSFDLTSFYHHIDPAFIANTTFLDAAGIRLSPWEYGFTRAFSAALAAWAEMTVSALEEAGTNLRRPAIGGIPIGLSMSRVIANALLVELDRDIEQGLAPVYYGRYVDDMFLVLRDPGNVKDSSGLLQFIARRVSWFPLKLKPDEIDLKFPREYGGRSRLRLQPAKQKMFFLEGHGGLDLLSSIESQVRSVSSERRLMPSVSRLEQMASAKVLSAAAHPSEEADTLRKAGGLSVRRLAWSVQLRAVEIIARDLRKMDWADERRQFYQFAHSHILRPDKILDHMDYLPRLLSLAVALEDWGEACRLVEATFDAIDALRGAAATTKIRLNGYESSKAGGAVWDGLRDTVIATSRDAVIRSIPWASGEGKARLLGETAMRLCGMLELDGDEDAILDRALSYREADWAKIPYKDHLRRDAARQRIPVPEENALHSAYERTEDLKDFLDRSGQDSDGIAFGRLNARLIAQGSAFSSYSLLPHLFPTRTYTTQEISQYLPDVCVFGDGAGPARNWARFVRAVRGVWVWESLVSECQDGFPSALDPDGRNRLLVAHIGSRKASSGVRLGISSLETTLDTWRSGAGGMQDLSRKRYERIECLVNQAITAFPKPTHLILPELALPERWIDTVSACLMDERISLVSGVDYQVGPPDKIHSSAVLVLTDDRLGFPSFVQIRQAKAEPAVGEDKELVGKYGRNWRSDWKNARKPVYRHNDFCFGVLVCSELQNMSHRLGFQGNVDCMMVLSWNQDLETFSSLVEAASLDVHAYVALVNNRSYGDSRVRSPAKQAYLRDVCRLKGGLNEHLVVVGMSTEDLRAFQSRAKPWPEKDDLFKPVPEGFRIAKYRRVIPE